MSSRNPTYPNADLFKEVQFSSIKGSDDRRLNPFVIASLVFGTIGLLLEKPLSMFLLLN